MKNQIKILTVDIEDWFHLLGIEQNEINNNYRIKENLDRLLNIFNKTNTKPTFFILASLAEKFPQLIYNVSQYFDIGSHGYNHTLASSMTIKEFDKDIAKSLKILKDITNKNITKYRSAGFSVYNKDYFEVIIDNGIEIDCSLSSINHFYGKKILKTDIPYIINCNGKQIKELTTSTISFFNHNIGFLGGGYFRLFPYFMIKKWTSNKKDYCLTYIHPRDFDIKQPKVDNLSYLRKFRHYVGIKNAETKLLKWLNDFEFVDINTANEQIDWQHTPIIDL